jgi:MFS family permease
VKICFRLLSDYGGGVVSQSKELPRAGVVNAQPTERHPFGALWVMMIGSFLIVVDSTVVAVANPVLREYFDVEYDSVIWVTSGYLLAFAALLLVGGRLGDRFGPKYVYLLGLAIFSSSSVVCGLSSSIEMLIAARITQGIGSALLAPQIFSTITRAFPSDRRGIAMSVWGATAGVGMLWARWSAVCCWLSWAGSGSSSSTSRSARSDSRSRCGWFPRCRVGVCTSTFSACCCPGRRYA